MTFYPLIFSCFAGLKIIFMLFFVIFPVLDRSKPFPRY